MDGGFALGERRVRGCWREGVLERGGGVGGGGGVLEGGGGFGGI